MPIYAYRCASCGHAKDVLQKVSDPVLTVCPSCGEEAFQKQLTAAGFQLKGSGWYATDFKGGGSAAPAKDKPAEGGEPKKEPASSAGDSKPGDSGGSSSASEAKPAASGGSDSSRASQ